MLVALELYTLLEATVFYPRTEETTPEGEPGEDARGNPTGSRELIAALQDLCAEEWVCDPRFRG